MEYQWYIVLFETSIRYQVSLAFFAEPSSEADALAIVPLAHSGRSGPDGFVNGFMAPLMICGDVPWPTIRAS